MEDVFTTYNELEIRLVIVDFWKEEKGSKGSCGEPLEPDQKAGFDFDAYFIIPKKIWDNDLKKFKTKDIEVLVPQPIFLYYEEDWRNEIIEQLEEI